MKSAFSRENFAGRLGFLIKVPEKTHPGNVLESFGELPDQSFGRKTTAFGSTVYLNPT